MCAHKHALTFVLLRERREPSAERRAISLCSHSKTVRRAPHRASPNAHTTHVPPTNTEYCTIRTHCSEEASERVRHIATPTETHSHTHLPWHD